MRHRIAKRHLSRTPSHLKAMRRNLAQSLFQYGQVETTLVKAKEVQPFVEKLITLARKGNLQSRRRAASLLGDRSILGREEQEQYDAMTDTQRRKVMVSRAGRRHRTGLVPASYNKKKIPFVAQSVVRKLVTEIAPSYSDRPGGYTRIIRLSKRRIGDNSDLVLLQLVGEEDTETPDSGTKKSIGQRRQKTLDRIRYLEGKKPKRSRKRGGKEAKSATASEEAPKESKKAQTEDDGGGETHIAEESAAPEPEEE